MKSKKSFFETFIQKPFKLLIANWTIFLLFFIFLAVANLVDKYSNFDLSLHSSSVFHSVASVFSILIHNPFVTAIFILGMLVKSYLIVAIGQDLMCIFNGTRKSLWLSMKGITWKSLIWFLKMEFLIYVIFNAIAIIFYTVCYAWWLSTGAEIAPMILLFGAFAFFYPAFYFSLSFISMVSVFPIDRKMRWSKIYYFTNWKAFRKTYLFYAIRLSVEYLFLFVLPTISLIVFKNELFAKIFALIGLLLPLLLLRGSAYMFKLRIMKDDPDVKALFPSMVESS